MHRAKASARVGPEHHGHASTAKAKGRLERAKDTVAAKNAATKREKARLRKKNKISDRHDAQKDTTASSEKPVDCNGSKSMKRVTFG
ncbi:hypothetical protein DICSQDRAFT_149424 [Dichomitus squalens LYAD-421 SS1]|uniref:Uncharacterized protein n=1 Tax=Dichomitus squalens (strain LYAD-421) TaxID=732165 RepID=R7SSR9_DICSQ|nr:uncharacterized protein DICSQDRAFT_149424 [Dichomitus squalens LYAD-421 SS1]EJF58037.1 hypothetical protein DICSQDRAFT_149424 [Dichomitus squalens LYAD-421 SS1]